MMEKNVATEGIENSENVRQKDSLYLRHRRIWRYSGCPE